VARAFHVRKATHRDLDLLVRHHRAMWIELGRFSKPALDASDSAYRRWLSQRIRRKRIVAFVAVGPEKGLVGSLTIWLHDNEPGPGQPRGVIPLLSTLYVERGNRRKGIGSALVRTATKWCRNSGYPYVTGIAAHTSRRLLGRLGYQRLWEMGQYFGNEPA